MQSPTFLSSPPHTELLGRYIIPTDPNNPDTSTADTVATMRQLSITAAHNPEVQHFGLKATSSLPNHAPDRQIVSCLFHAVRDWVKFKEDEEIEVETFGGTVSPEGIDVLISPELLIKTREGDCDDFSMLLASLLIDFGFRVKFVTVAAGRDLPWKFSHIFVKVYLEDENEWIGLDASHGAITGWETDQQYRRKEWDIN